VGSTRLTGSVAQVPDARTSAEDAFSTEESLPAYLRGRRNASSGHTLEGDMAIPPWLARNDIVGFEITRRFRPFDYDLANPFLQALGFLGITPENAPDFLINGTVRLSPQRLERELGGPEVWDFDARIHALGGGADENYVQNYLSSRQQLPPNAFPIPALQLSPVLRYNQLLEIERMLQHVVRNTVFYSKAVWLSLSPEERAIMLEGYTIGVPPGGITDETQTSRC
jgi:hypothetical protein